MPDTEVNVQENIHQDESKYHLHYTCNDSSPQASISYERKLIDKLVSVRVIFKDLVESFRYYSIGEYTNIDGMLLGLRDRCSFSQADTILKYIFWWILALSILTNQKYMLVHNQQNPIPTVLQPVVWLSNFPNHSAIPRGMS